MPNPPTSKLWPIAGAYFAATLAYVLFFSTVIVTNRLFAANNTVAYVIAGSLLFLIPLAGVIHLSRLRLSKRQFRRIGAMSLVAGLAGPLLLSVSIQMSDDGEAAMAYVLIPVAYAVFCLIGYSLLLIGCLVRGKHAQTHGG